MSTARTPGIARPRWLLLAALLGAQAWFATHHPRDWQADFTPGLPPSYTQAMLASLGERHAAGYGLTLYVQTFDAQAGQHLRIGDFDLGAIGVWLDRALDLNPDSAYPLLLATRVYAESARPAQSRELLALVERRFLQDPARRWPWLAHAVYLARHVLNDRPLALHLARLLRERTRGLAVPGWVAQTELLLLVDSDLKQSARTLLGALIDSGQVADPAERAFLLQRLQQAEQRVSADERPATGRPNDR